MSAEFVYDVEDPLASITRPARRAVATISW